MGNVWPGNLHGSSKVKFTQATNSQLNFRPATSRKEKKTLIRSTFGLVDRAAQTECSFGRISHKISLRVLRSERDLERAVKLHQIPAPQWKRPFRQRWNWVSHLPLVIIECGVDRSLKTGNLRSLSDTCSSNAGKMGLNWIKNQATPSTLVGSEVGLQFNNRMRSCKYKKIHCSLAKS